MDTHTYIHHIGITILLSSYTASTFLGRPAGPDPCWRIQLCSNVHEIFCPHTVHCLIKMFTNFLNLVRLHAGPDMPRLQKLNKTCENKRRKDGCKFDLGIFNRYFHDFFNIFLRIPSNLMGKYEILEG
jgi:hypothetical protein